MSRMAVVLMALAVTACDAEPAATQDWQTVNSSRQRSAEESLDVRVRYGAGRLAVRPSTTAGELYRVGITYDAENFRAVSDYEDGQLVVGVRSAGRDIRIRDNDPGEMDLRLTRDVPMNLGMEFGAVAAELELGGLDIRDLRIETGASDTQLTFSSPNSGVCESLDLSLGAAAFRAEGLGHAGCAELEVEGGVGDVTLDFGGQWRGSVSADISMALGSLTLIIPENIGVRVDRSTFLTGFEGRGLERRDGVYYSSNWETAEHRLDLELSGAFGSVNLRWRNP